VGRISKYIFKKPFPNVCSVLMKNYILIRKIVRRAEKAPSANDHGAFFAGEYRYDILQCKNISG
jgi:hypothetical protein